MNTIIIDDEAPARNSLKSLLATYCPQINLTDEAHNVAEGLALIEEVSPDLVFLDIEMPDGTGFDLLRQCGSVDFPIIFTTAHEAYAVEAFKFSAVDYLLKPINPMELQTAVDRAQKAHDQENLQIQIGALLENISHLSEGLKKIILKDSESIHIVQVADIIRLESDRNYTTFYLSNSKPIVVSRTIKEFDAMLAKSGFFRVHQSHLVNLNALKRFDKKDGGSLIMRDDSMVPISSRKKDKLLKVLETF